MRHPVDRRAVGGPRAGLLARGDRGGLGRAEQRAGRVVPDLGRGAVPGGGGGGVGTPQRREEQQLQGGCGRHRHGRHIGVGRRHGSSRVAAAGTMATVFLHVNSPFIAMNRKSGDPTRLCAL